jgi:type IV secretory pathway VirB2 component (pilin)
MTKPTLYLSFLVASLGRALAGPASAAGAKPGGAGGQTATKAGDNLADLISGNLTQLLIVFVGAFGIAAFASRSIGQAMMIVVIGLFAGLFIIEPDGALSLFKSIYDAVL